MSPSRNSTSSLPYHVSFDPSARIAKIWGVESKNVLKRPVSKADLATASAPPTDKRGYSPKDNARLLPSNFAVTLNDVVTSLRAIRTPLSISNLLSASTRFRLGG